MTEFKFSIKSMSLPFILISPSILNDPLFLEFKRFKRVVFPAPLEPNIASTSLGRAIPLTYY